MRLRSDLMVAIGAALILLLVAASAYAASCRVSGDSIAIDIGHFAPRGCVIDAKIGIGSAAIIARVKPADLVVISAGSNDPDNPNLARNLVEMRARAQNSRVVWVVPVNHVAAADVVTIAQMHGDRAVTFAPAGDHVHPRCPQCVAREIFGK